MATKKKIISKSFIKRKATVTAREKTGLKLILTARELAKIVTEKERIKLELVMTAKDLAKAAIEKEKTSLRLITTNEELAWVAKEKEKTRLKLIITARELAKIVVEKERIRLELVVAAKDLAKMAIEKEGTLSKLDATNEELSKNEFWLKKSQHVAKIGSYLLCIKTGLWSSSDELDKIFGIDSHFKRSVENWVKIIHPEHQQMMADYFQNEVLKQKNPFNKEYKVTQQDSKQTIWVHGLGELIFDKNKNPVKMLGTIQNITERKQAEEIIKNSEEKFRALFESAKAGIFILEPNGKIFSLNKSFADMHGYTVKELMKMGLKDLDVPETAKLAPERMQKLMSGESLRFEVEHYCKNRTTIPLDVSANLVVIGNKKYVLAFHHDISERKKIEENFRRIFDESPIGIATMEIKDFKFTKVNKTLCDFLGYNQEELLLLGIRDITHQDHIATDLGGLKKILEEKIAVYKTEKRYVRKNGDVVWGLTTSNFIKERDGGRYLLMTIENITYRKLADEQLQKKIEEINSFFDITPDLMCISDSGGKFIRINRCWEKVFGYAIKDLLNKNLLDFVHPEDKDLTQKLLNLSTQEPVVDFTNRFIAKDGSYRKLEWRSRPLGGIVYSTARDITERKEKSCEPPQK